MSDEVSDRTGAGEETGSQRDGVALRGGADIELGRRVLGMPQTEWRLITRMLVSVYPVPGKIFPLPCEL